MQLTLTVSAYYIRHSGLPTTHLESDLLIGSRLFYIAINNFNCLQSQFEPDKANLININLRCCFEPGSRFGIALVLRIFNSSKLSTMQLYLLFLFVSGGTFCSCGDIASDSTNGIAQPYIDTSYNDDANSETASSLLDQHTNGKEAEILDQASTARQVVEKSNKLSTGNKSTCSKCKAKCVNWWDHPSDAKVLFELMGLPTDQFKRQTPTLELVNNEDLDDVLSINQNIRNLSQPSNCSIVIFYASWCQWCARLAPHFNAIPRSFPNIRFAAFDVNSHMAFDVNDKYGIHSVPTVILFHNGKPHARVTNDTVNIQVMAEFLETFTDQKIQNSLEIIPVDYEGPMSSSHQLVNTLWPLIASWMFIIVSMIYYLVRMDIPWKLFLSSWFNIQGAMEDEEYKKSK